MTENLKLGVLGFIVFVLVLLGIFRLTRQNRSIRDRIKLPLLALFLLVTINDIFFSLGKPFPKDFYQYYLALIYLFAAILFIRLTLLFFFDVFLVRNKKYRAPRLLKEITGFALFIIVIVMILQDTLHIQVTTVLATSAIITVVLGLAMQETLGNLFAGVALHLDPPYQVGDWIHAGDIVGKVEEVTWRATKLRNTNNDYIIIPNGGIAKEKLTNHSFPRIPHATAVDVTVAYTIPPNKVSEIATEALKGIPNVVFDPVPDIRIKNFQDFGVLYSIKFWFKDYGEIEPTLSDVRRAVWYHFRRNQIEIPYPIRDIYVHDRAETEAESERKIKHLSDSLHKIYLFSDLAEDERRLVADHLVEMHFAAGEVIIREGESGNSFFILDRGEVEVFITSAHQNKKVLTTLGPGDFFGEIALLTGEKRTASVLALSDVLVYQLSKVAFKDVLETKPMILDEIGSVLSRRKDQLADLMMEITGNPKEVASMTPQDAKSRILKSIRSYFGL